MGDYDGTYYLTNYSGLEYAYSEIPARETSAPSTLTPWPSTLRQGTTHWTEAGRLHSQRMQAIPQSFAILSMDTRERSWQRGGFWVV